MDEVGRFLIQLHMPIGAIVTGLLPVAAIAGFVAAFWAQYKRRTALMVVALAVAVLSLLGSIAFISVAAAP